jgi:CRP-like cAMP-binding protein
MAARVEDLRAIPLFARLDADALGQIAEATNEVDVPAGQPLIQPGAAGSGMFFVIDGTVEVEARESTRELGPGDFFGELALLDGGPRSASVVAATPMVCIRVFKRAFDRLIADEPGVAATMLTALAGRLRQAERPVTA